MSEGMGYWTRVNGHRMYYLRAGTGTPVLLLHGGGDSGEGSFPNQIDPLIAAGYAVIAPDQVGQGHTPDQPGHLSYSAMMEDTAALLRKLHIRHIDVVGFSDGGILGLMLAVRYPGLVRRLAVSGVNISPEGLRQDDLDALRAERDAAAQAGEARTIAAKLRELWLSAPGPDELSPAMLAKVGQPVLVIAGDRDMIRLDHVLDVYRALPNAQLFILPDTGHGTFQSRPELVNRVLLEFLRAS